MNKFVNTAIWVVLFIFLLPSSLAVASWNSLPGSRLFAVKLWMEQALVAITPSDQTRGDLQIAYTERRFSEAKRLLADQTSVQGLVYLDSQVNTTKEAILATRDPFVKQQLAQKYVAQLRDVSNQLEQQKQIVQASQPAPARRITQPPQQQPPPTAATPVIQQVIINNVMTTVVVYVTPAPGANAPAQSTPTPTPVPSVPAAGPAGDVAGSIDNTQQTINEAITEISEAASGTTEIPTPTLAPTPTPIPTPTPPPPYNQGQGQGQGHDKDKDKKN